MTDHEILTSIQITLARVDERTAGIRERLEDHIDHHDNTRQIVTEELAKCQAAHRHSRPPVGLSAKGVAVIVSASLLGLTGLVVALLKVFV